MAFKDSSSDIVISDAGELLHKSFNRLSGTIASTRQVIQLENLNNFLQTTQGNPNNNDAFGFSVAVGSGIIIVGVPRDDNQGSQAGSVGMFTLDGAAKKLIFGDTSLNAPGDLFGYWVAVGCGKIVVGSPDDHYFTTEEAGSIHIFDLDGVGIPRTNAAGVVGPQYLPRLFAGSIADPLDGNVQADAFFGRAVAVGCGRIVVGAPFDDRSTTPSTSNSGSAFIYDLTGNIVNVFFAVNHLTGAADEVNDDNFGFSVAVGCGRIVVGAPNNDDPSNSGSAYIYDLDGNILKKITASDAAADDQFGRSVAIGSGKIVVGAPFNDNPTDSGSAYIFDLNGTQLKKITGADYVDLIAGGATGDSGDNANFGFSVAVGCGKIVVGAPDETVALAQNAGSVYVFDLEGTQLEKIYDDNYSTGSRFGRSVAVGSGRIVVGVPFKDIVFDSVTKTDAGQVHIFDLDENYDTYIERQLGY